MLPESDFYRRKNLMFLIVGMRYYNVENAQPVNKDYLELCSLRFPLKQGRMLTDEENSYLKINKKILQNLKTEIEKEITKKGAHLNDIKIDVETKEDILFFLSKICKPHNQKVDKNNKIQGEEQESFRFFLEDNELIFPRIINKDYAVINKRLYPLKTTENPVFVSLNSQNYTIDVSNKTVEEVESTFQRFLKEKIRIQALKDSVKTKELEKKISNLNVEIASLEIELNVSKFVHCYETGDIGYDFTSKLVYWLIPAHYNHTTGKSYEEGQSAATLPLQGGKIGNTWRFAERKNRNSQFVTRSESHCLGFSLVGDSLEEKMQFLHTFANVVKENGAFYQISGSSNDDYSYY